MVTGAPLGIFRWRPAARDDRRPGWITLLTVNRRPILGAMEDEPDAGEAGEVFDHELTYVLQVRGHELEELSHEPPRSHPAMHLDPAGLPAGSRCTPGWLSPISAAVCAARFDGLGSGSPLEVAARSKTIDDGFG